MEHPRYSYRVWWSPRDQEYVAMCSEIPTLSGLAETEAEAIAECKVAVAAWIDYLIEEGLPVPAADPPPIHDVRSGAAAL